MGVSPILVSLHSVGDFPMNHDYGRKGIDHQIAVFFIVMFIFGISGLVTKWDICTREKGCFHGSHALVLDFSNGKRLVSLNLTPFSSL